MPTVHLPLRHPSLHATCREGAPFPSHLLTGCLELKGSCWRLGSSSASLLSTGMKQRFPRAPGCGVGALAAQPVSLPQGRGPGGPGRAAAVGPRPCVPRCWGRGGPPAASGPAQLAMLFERGVGGAGGGRPLVSILLRIFIVRGLKLCGDDHFFLHRSNCMVSCVRGFPAWNRFWNKPHLIRTCQRPRLRRWLGSEALRPPLREGPCLPSALGVLDADPVPRRGAGRAVTFCRDVGKP